ncbi:MAG: serine/threonine-protein kinase, partial [Verrucomicrobiota bacterium]
MKLTTDRIADFRLGEVLTESPDRAVYRAESDLGQSVILKIAQAKPGKGNSIETEYQTIAQLEGAAIAPFIAYGTDDALGLDYLALADKGSSLSQLLAKAPGERFTSAQAIVTMLAMAEALESLHQRGWIHGDLKPGNVVISDDVRATLIDLESARLLPPPDSEAVFSGTPPFLPPEVLKQGSKALSKAADVWALGITLYLTTVGKYPFGSGTVNELASVLDSAPTLVLPDDLDSDVGSVLLRLLAFDPRQRPADATEAARLLRASLNEGVRESARLEIQALLGDDWGENERESYTLDIATVAVAPPKPKPAGAASALPPPPAKASPEPSRRKMKKEADSKPSSPPLPAPVMASAPLEEEMEAPPSATFERSTAARWFRRMNPNRAFELSVFFSAGEIRIVPGENMGVNIGQNRFEIDEANPDVEVEPHFPGCLVTPSRIRVDLTPELVTTKFWVTPLAIGNMKSACVRVYYQGRLVDTLATPAKVVTRTSARAAAIVGIGWPFIYPILELRGWTWTDQVEQQFPILKLIF